VDLAGCGGPRNRRVCSTTRAKVEEAGARVACVRSPASAWTGEIMRAVNARASAASLPVLNTNRWEVRSRTASWGQAIALSARTSVELTVPIQEVDAETQKPMEALDYSFECIRQCGVNAGQHLSAATKGWGEFHDHSVAGVQARDFATAVAVPGWSTGRWWAGLGLSAGAASRQRTAWLCERLRERRDCARAPSSPHNHALEEDKQAFDLMHAGQEHARS